MGVNELGESRCRELPVSCYQNGRDYVAWGYGGPSVGGGLGLGNTTTYSSPVQVGALTNWSSVSNSFESTIAVKTDGTMWSWGNNGNGQLGLGDTITRSSPVQVGALTDWAQIGGKNFFCLAVRTNGTLWAWGINTFGAGIAGGQLGQNDVINRSSPVQVGALTSWKNVAPGALNESAIALETA